MFIYHLSFACLSFGRMCSGVAPSKDSEATEENYEMCRPWETATRGRDFSLHERE